MPTTSDLQRQIDRLREQDTALWEANGDLDDRVRATELDVRTLMVKFSIVAVLGGALGNVILALVRSGGSLLQTVQ